jgi:Amt family ammonium transporter
VRRKNVLSMLMQSFLMMGMISVLWVIYGYSLAFGDGGEGVMSRFIGSLQYFMLDGVGAAPNTDYAGTVPQQTFMLFQMMFAIITPALITGAVAERMKFSALAVFMILWFTFIYCPLAHMTWGINGLFNWFYHAPIPALDFAGGTVVHISSGVSALVAAIFLGKRHGYPREPIIPHSVVLSFIGACLLWVGWFGFNAGSALSGGSLATSAFAATHFSSAAGALAWIACEWITRRQPSVLGGISGAVAGLVAVTPAAGFVAVPSALVIGAVASIVCYLAVSRLKTALGYDDSLDAFGIHGVGGAIGALFTGIFASAGVNEAIATTYTTSPASTDIISLAGGFGQFLNQLQAVGVTVLFTGVGTAIILLIVRAVMGLRVEHEDEIMGLDLSEHGEEGWNLVH